MTTRREFLKVCTLAPIMGCVPTAWLRGSEDLGSASLRQRCEESLRETYALDPKKWAGGSLSPAVLDRLDKEIAILERLGLVKQFHKLWALSSYLRTNGISFFMRGQANASLVVFASSLGTACPLHYGLLVECFTERPWFGLHVALDKLADVQRFVHSLFPEDNPRTGPMKIGVHDSEFIDRMKGYSQVDWTRCPADDPEAFLRLLQIKKGDTIGVQTRKGALGSANV